MALKKCKECGEDVSDKAKKCPKCGAPVPKIGVKEVVLGIVALWILGSVISWTESLGKPSGSSDTQSAQTSSETSSQEVATYKMGQTVQVGYMSYFINKTRWSNHLRPDNEFMDEKPNACFLFVDLVARNDDKQERMIPPLKLIDENGSEYGSYSNTGMAKNGMSLMENLNPKVQKRGIVVFDVPKGHSYRLQLDGGYWSSDKAFVQLNTK